MKLVAFIKAGKHVLYWHEAININKCAKLAPAEVKCLLYHHTQTPCNRRREYWNDEIYACIVSEDIFTVHHSYSMRSRWWMLLRIRERPQRRLWDRVNKGNEETERRLVQVQTWPNSCLIIYFWTYKNFNDIILCDSLHASIQSLRQYVIWRQADDGNQWARSCDGYQKYFLFHAKCVVEDLWMTVGFGWKMCKPVIVQLLHGGILQWNLTL